MRFLLVVCALATVSGLGSAQATVRVKPANVEGPRILEPETAAAAIRNYLQAWQTMNAALDRNRADLLDQDFVGTAKDKLAETVRSQAAIGIRSRYQDRVHEIQIVFYSPEGLSIELTDTVDYDVQIFDHDQAQAAARLRARYTAILTPSEVRWRVRVFQGQAEQ